MVLDRTKVAVNATNANTIRTDLAIVINLDQMVVST